MLLVLAVSLLAIAGSAAADTTVTLAVVDGYDAKQGKTLVQDGKLYVVNSSDNDWFQVEAGYWLSLRFAGSIPAGATIQSVKVGVEHYEEPQISSAAILWQVGAGTIQSPTAAASFRPALLIDKSAEATVEWDVSGTIDTPAEVNGLVFTVRNEATNGKKGFLDRVYLRVQYAEQPTAPTITSTPGTSATVGQPYSYQAQATGTQPITWALLSGPAAMSVNASGLVSWTPTASGSFPVSLRASNSVGQATQSWTIAVTTAPSSVVVLAAGDIAGCDTNGDEQTAAVLDANPTGTVLTLGDNVYPDGTSSEYATCYHPTWGRHLGRTRPSPGNHEYHTSGAAGYFGYYGAAAGPAGRGYYSFDVGAWHVISLNSEQDYAAGGTQLSWLTADLAGTSAQCVLAFWHKPRFTAGNYVDFTEYVPFWNALYAANADVVLNGHDHNYQRYRPMNPSGAADSTRGIREFVVGTGGRSHYGLAADSRREAANSTAFGVLRLTLRATGYDWEFLPAAGATFGDSGSGTCH